MNWALLSANIERLLTNIWAIISFLREFAVDNTKDVSITYINADGSESVKTFPNIARMVDTLRDVPNYFGETLYLGFYTHGAIVKKKIRIKSNYDTDDLSFGIRIEEQVTRAFAHISNSIKQVRYMERDAGVLGDEIVREHVEWGETAISVVATKISNTEIEYEITSLQSWATYNLKISIVGYESSRSTLGTIKEIT